MNAELKVVQGVRKKSAMFHQWENVSYPVRAEAENESV